MKEVVGHTAGKVWQLLKDKGEMAVSQIPRAVGEPAAITNQAIGWLAREDKIVYKNKGGKNSIALSD